MAEVRYINAYTQYEGNPLPSINDLNLDIVDGEFMVLVGPSGSGKSTALRMLAGLEPVTQGSIEIAGRDVSKIQPKDRDIAMVFQNYALYPHMSVADNMAFALKLKGVNKDERMKAVREAAKVLDLEPYLERKPKALSGGQRQRVAMGRAIVRNPAVFLMDEPLSNLDAKLRVETRANIAALQQRLGTTTLYVTHDQVEAMTMGHRVAVLKEGGFLQQVDTPHNLYDIPANAFVAGFIGSPAMNLRPVDFNGTTVKFGGAEAPLSDANTAAARAAGVNKLILGVRPEDISVEPGPAGIKMKVDLVEETGADAYIYGTLAGDEADTKKLIVRHKDDSTLPHIGEWVPISMHVGEEHIFNADTGNRIR
jgi:multiple sugar transport system ATP-binding protein